MQIKLFLFNDIPPYEPGANNCFSIISKYQGLKKNGLKHKNTDAVVHVHTRICSRSFNNREFKQITMAGATTAAVTEKVWGEYVPVVCQVLSLASKAKYKDERNIG